jgi:hypothetical protein
MNRSMMLELVLKRGVEYNAKRLLVNLNSFQALTLYVFQIFP